jgi:hypothetical protein
MGRPKAESRQGRKVGDMFDDETHKAAQRREICGALNGAIKVALQLNEEADSVLKSAVNMASGDPVLAHDYRLKYAERMLLAGSKRSNVATKYFLARAKAAKAGK